MNTEEEAQQHLYSRPPLDPSAEDSLAKIARRIPHGSTVLDVGCAVGVLGQYLTEQQDCNVDGIEMNADAAEIARPFYRRIMVTDLESADLRYLLEGARYDRIVCADVLEHLRDPGQVLQRLKDHLTPDGKILISIPNIGHIGVFLELLSGDFRYREEGLLDRTHLRFFTRKSFLRLLIENGFSGQIVDRTVVDLQHSEFSGTPPETLSSALLREMQSWSDSITYQFIIEARIQEEGVDTTLIHAIDEATSYVPHFACQVFWRSNDDNFTESCSQRIHLPMKVERQRVNFTFPKGRVRALRFDPSDRKGFMRLYGMRLFDGDNCLWAWNGEDIEALFCGALHGVFPAPLKTSKAGVVLAFLNEDPWLELAVPVEILSRTESLEVELSWPMSADYLAVQEEWENLLHQNQRLHTELKVQQQTSQMQLMEMAAAEQTQRKIAATNLERCHTWWHHQLNQNVFLRSERSIVAEQQINLLSVQLQNVEAELRAILGSNSWRVTAPLRKLVQYTRNSKKSYFRRAKLLVQAIRGDHIARQRIAQSLYRRIGSTSTSVTSAQDTPLEPCFSATWLALFDTPSAEVLDHFRLTADIFPNIHFVLHFTKKTIHIAPRTKQHLECVVGLYWSATVLTDPSCTSQEVTHIREIFANDARFVFELTPNNDAPVILLQGGALPRAHGPRVLVEALLDRPGTTVAYADESKVDDIGRIYEPWFKPEYSPLLSKQNMLMGRMIALRAANIANLTDPLEFLRHVTLTTDKSNVVHVPHILFHDAAPSATPLPLYPQSLDNPLPMVSILIPTRNLWDLLKNCIDSIERSEWPRERLEVIVVDNGSNESTTLNGLNRMENQGRVRVLRDSRPFNYARLNNEAARQARGDLLILLNNDTEVIDPKWIRKLASFALHEGVGAVGPKLLYPDRSVQHGGIVLGIQGVAAHAHIGLSEAEGGYAGLANLTHEVSAVTGACIAVSKAHYDAIGGLDELFHVAFNDVMFCLDLQQSGLRNIYLAEPLLIHHESKSRGYDDTPEKLAVATTEARNAWIRHSSILRSDPFYSPNLSLETVYAPAFAPRRRAEWDHVLSRMPRVMILSCTYARGHGVAVVIKLQVEALVARGHTVIVGGPISKNDIYYPGCERVEIHDPRIAAMIAAERGIDVIVAHTPPFFSVARWTGDYPRVMAYDHGEPPPSIFPDCEARQAMLNEKDQSLVMCARVFAISDAIASESRTPVNGVIPLGNAHLGCWDASLQDRRKQVRAMYGWTDRFVVLNVCRFHQNERTYKGVDTFISVHNALEIEAPDLTQKSVFVLCGKGDQSDIAAMTAEGLKVVANVSDEELVDLYCAADAYANFSTWEGYNLGIGQALAMGLPVVASDIPAHRAFGISTTNKPYEAAAILAELHQKVQERTARIWSWTEPLAQYVTEVEALCPADVRPNKTGLDEPTLIRKHKAIVNPEKITP